METYTCDTRNANEFQTAVHDLWNGLERLDSERERLLARPFTAAASLRTDRLDLLDERATAWMRGALA